MTVISAATTAAKSDGPTAAPGSAPSNAAGDLTKVDRRDFLRELKRRLIENDLDPDTFDEELHDLLETADYGEGVDSPTDLTTAADWWQRGDKREALHFLEYALGRDFSGIGDLKPEDLL